MTVCCQINDLAVRALRLRDIIAQIHGDRGLRGEEAACVGLGDIRSLAPSVMSGAFGVGMAFVAAIHYLSAKKASIDEDKEF